MSQVFFHRKTRHPNGQTDEITLGRPLAAVLVMVCLAIVALKGGMTDFGVLVEHALHLLSR